MSATWLGKVEGRRSNRFNVALLVVLRQGVREPGAIFAMEGQLPLLRPRKRRDGRRLDHERAALTAEKISVRDRSMKVDMQIGQHGGLKATKTGEERTVDVSSKLLALLTSLFHVEGERPTGPWLFYPELGPSPSEKDVQRVYKNALRAMRRCLKAAGLPTYFGLHALRHTYAPGSSRRQSPPPTCRRRWDTPRSSRRWTPTAAGSLPGFRALWTRWPSRSPHAVDTGWTLGAL